MAERGGAVVVVEGVVMVVVAVVVEVVMVMVKWVALVVEGVVVVVAEGGGVKHQVGDENMVSYVKPFMMCRLQFTPRNNALAIPKGSMIYNRGNCH